MAGLVLCIIGKRMEASKADSLALGSASRSLPLGSIDDSLNGEWFFPLALKERHLLLTYAHPLKGASLHVCNALFVKSGEQRWTPSQYCLQQPVRFFSPTLKTFVVSWELAANHLVPLWVEELSSPSLLSPIVEDHSVKPAGKLLPSRQAKAGPDYPACISGTEAYRTQGTWLWGFHLALTRSSRRWDHQHCPGRAADDCLAGLCNGRAIRL